MAGKTIKSEQIWISLFLVIPVVILIRLSEYFTQDSLTKILYSGFFGAIGGLVGYGSYSVVKTSKSFVKTITLIVLTIFSISTLLLINHYKYTTCDICGYVAVDNKTKECNVCGSVTWEKKLSYDKEKDKNQWIVDEQLLWFSIDSLNQQTDFYKPEIQDGFRKDNSWSPKITAKDLAENYLDKTRVEK